MTFDQRVAVLGQLCIQHSCSPNELFSTITLNPIPEALKGLVPEFRNQLVAITEVSLEKYYKYNRPIPFDLFVDSERIENLTAVIEKCLIYNLDHPSKIVASALPPNLRNANNAVFSRIYVDLSDWLNWTPSQDDIRIVRDYVADTNIQISAVFMAAKERKVFKDSHILYLARVAWEIVYPHKPAVTPEVFDTSFDETLQDLKKVAIYHSDAAARIASILSKLSQISLSSINYHGKMGSTELSISKDVVKLTHNAVSWDEVDTEHLAELETLLQQLIVTELRPWVKRVLNQGG